MSTASQLSRRDFLAATAALGAVATLRAAGDAAAPLVDTHVYLGRWPFRRVPLDEPAALVGKLREHGVASAWVGTPDALLHKDLAAANARLADDCVRHGAGLLLPMGTVNPAHPGWEAELRRCAELHGMKGVRLFPNYHGYTLAEPRAAAALARATELGLLVQIAVQLRSEEHTSELQSH